MNLEVHPVNGRCGAKPFRDADELDIGSPNVRGRRRQ
jgi:hypothetical protein